MPRPRLFALGVASIAATSLLLVGCTSPGGGSGGGGDLTWEDSPLLEYSNAIYGGDRENEDYIAEANAAEELIATCMADEGFEYIPVDQAQYYSFDDEDVDRDTEEWVAANGYGYNLTEEQQAEQDAQWEDFVDPNQDYVMSLSESEQTAYYEVLQGPQPTEEEMADPDFMYQQLGCYGEAYTAVRGEQVYEKPEFKSIIDAMNELWEKQQDLPAVKAVNAAWSSCMADAGYPDLKTKDAVYELMNAQSEEAYADGAEEISPEKRAEMRDYEIDLALADFHCAEEVDYQKVTLEAQFELEEQFIADNKSELDTMLAAAGQEK